jgi:CubicO group peptidase (beta-lactamase class C family)
MILNVFKSLCILNNYLLAILLSTGMFISAIANGQEVVLKRANLKDKVDFERLKRIDTLLENYLKKGWLNGVVTLIQKDGQLIQNKGYGYADLERKKRMEPNTLFRIMSQTKAITSVAIMMLYEEGRFQLEEPISDFLPEYKNMKVLDIYNPKDTTFTTRPAQRQITFLDLLTHTSGLSYPEIGDEKLKAIYKKANIPSGLGYFNADLGTKMKELAKLPLLHQPGAHFTYGLNSDLLGFLIEKMSGQTLESFFNTRIFKPLGMKDTYFNVPKIKAGRLATAYTENDAHQVIKWAKTFRNINPDYPLISKHYFSGGAGLTSSARDYAIILQMLLNKGKYHGVQYLSRHTVEMMTVNQIDTPASKEITFGLGFEITTENKAKRQSLSKGSYNWGGYFGTYYWVDPKEHLVCLFMIQHTPNSHAEVRRKFEQLVYQSLK